MSIKCEQPLPVVRVGEIPREDHGQRWLVQQLWGESAVGVIGGAPKCSKTWLALDLARTPDQRSSRTIWPNVSNWLNPLPVQLQSY